MDMQQAAAVRVLGQGDFGEVDRRQGGAVIAVADQLAGDLDTDIVLCFRSEEHTSELQSLMRISYAVFCLKKKTAHQRVVQHPKTQHKIKLTQMPHRNNT